MTSQICLSGDAIDTASEQRDGDESILGAGVAAIRAPKPKLPAYLVRTSKPAYSKVPAFPGKVTHDVTWESECLNAKPVRGPSLRKKAVFASMARVLESGLRKTYQSVQVIGLSRMRDEDGHFAFPGPMVFLPTHTDNPRDGELLPGLYRFMPQQSDGRGGSHWVAPHFVMKPSETLYETVGTDVLFRGTVIHQRPKPPGPDGQNPLLETLRKAENLAILSRGAKRVMRDGIMSIFNEGNVDGPGIVQPSGGVGGVRVFIDHKGRKNPFIPVHLAYSNLGRVRERRAMLFPMHQPMKAIINLGVPFVVDTPRGKPNTPLGDQFDAQLRADLQKRQSMGGILTLDALVGAMALDAKAEQLTLKLDANTMYRLVTRVVHDVLAQQDGPRPTDLNEVGIDSDLLNDAKLRDMCAVAEKQLKDNGYLSPDNTFNTDKLGDRDDMNSPAKPHKLHRTNPLTYWGRRLQQQTKYVRELRDILAKHHMLQIMGQAA